MSERMLLERARAGDGHARDALIRRYEELAGVIVSHYFLRGGDRADLMQEARIGVVNAIRDYRPGRSALRSFVSLCVHRSVITAVKLDGRQKHWPVNFAGDLDELELSADGDPARAVVAKEDWERVRSWIRTELSELERRAVEMDAEGWSYQVIADTLKVTFKAVDNALWRARRKIRPALE